MIRNWLRQWLGIDDHDRLLAGIMAELVPRQSIIQLEERLSLAWERIVELEKMNPGAVMTEVHQLREMIQDPHRAPVVTKTMRQYRALMEQD